MYLSANNESDQQNGFSSDHLTTLFRQPTAALYPSLKHVRFQPLFSQLSGGGNIIFSLLTFWTVKNCLRCLLTFLGQPEVVAKNWIAFAKVFDVKVGEVAV